MEIKRYSLENIEDIFRLQQSEGDQWSDYWGEDGRDKFKKALGSPTSIVLLAYEGDELCGYVRARNDDGFGIYVYDLLVKRSKRGNGLGRLLMEAVCKDFPNEAVYVMSDVDGYYGKLGYARIGSVFAVTQPGDGV